MKKYKLWIQIEEYDTETEQYRDLCDAGEVEPVPMGTVSSLERAIEIAERNDRVLDTNAVPEELQGKGTS